MIETKGETVLNLQNQKALRQWVIDHQDNMNVRLPPIPEMHSARNAWCHLFGCIDDVYHTRGHGGYKVIPDSEFDNCIKIFEIAYKYAEDIDVYDRFPQVSWHYDDPKPSNDLTQWFT